MISIQKTFFREIWLHYSSDSLFFNESEDFCPGLPSSWESAWHIAKDLQDKRLEIVLSSFTLSAQQCERLINAPSLAILTLSKCVFLDQGAEFLRHLEGNQTLEHLTLEFESEEHPLGLFSPVQFIEFCSVIQKNTSLTRFVIVDPAPLVRASPYDWKQMFEALKLNSTLEEMTLGKRYMDRQHWDLLCETLQGSKTLQRVDIIGILREVDTRGADYHPISDIGARLETLLKAVESSDAPLSHLNFDFDDNHKLLCDRINDEISTREKKRRRITNHVAA